MQNYTFFLNTQTFSMYYNLNINISNIYIIKKYKSTTIPAKNIRGDSNFSPTNHSSFNVHHSPLFLVGHDVENHVIGLVHAVFAEAAEIVDGAVDVAFAEAVGAIDHTVVDCQLSTDKGAV